MNKLLVIDGMALLFRHFFATSFRNQFMYNKDGVPTNGVQGTIRHIYKVIELTQPNKVIVTWDMGSKTIRNDWFKDYKIKRPTPPKALIPQFDFVKEVITELGIYQAGMVGYEADDLIGTIAKHHDNTVIISGDKDLLQVIEGNNELWLTKKGYTEYNKYDYKRFLKEYEITPTQFIDVKALMGDSGDGYFGVKGIGEKTALSLIKKFESLEYLLKNLNSVTASQREKIERDYDHLLMSQKLARIITDVPIDVNEALLESDFLFDQEITKSVLEKYDLSIAKRYIEGLNL